MYQTITQHIGLLQKSAIGALGVMAICVAFIAIQKITASQRMKTTSMRLIGLLDDNLRHQRIDATIEVCKAHRDSHLSKVIVAGMIERKSCDLRSMPDTVLTLAVREAMDRSVSMQVLEWKEHLGFVDAVGRTAPFVGVVIGNAVGVAAGTLLSLFTIWLVAFLRGRGDALEVELKSVASEMRQFLSTHAQCKKCGADSYRLHQEAQYTCERCCPKCRQAA